MPDSGSDTEGFVQRLRRRLWVERVVLLALLAILAGLYLGAIPGGRRVTIVAVDGEPVAVLATHADAQRVLSALKATADIPPDKLSFAQKVTLHRVSAVRNPVQSDREAMQARSQALDLRVTGAAVLADGDLVIALPSEEEAVQTLSMLLRRFSPKEPTAPPYFKERVKVEMQQVAPEALMPSAEAAAQRIVDEAAPRGVHEVRPGESAWQLARDHGVTLTRLQHANPEADLERITVGQKLNIPGALPPLTVVARREIEEPVGEGSLASTRTVRITYENGVVVKREMIGRRAVPRPPPRPPTREEPWRWRDEVTE
jgi:LysM repeat protein